MNLWGSYNNANGGTIATKRMVEELRKRGHEIRIVSAIHEDPSDSYFYKISGYVLPDAEASQENSSFFSRGRPVASIPGH